MSQTRAVSHVIARLLEGYGPIEDFVILILQRGKARIARFALDLRGETDCPVNPPDFLAALRRWRPDLVTVIDAPGFAEELAAEVNRASGRDMMLLIAPMPELGEEQAPTQVGIILPDSFDSRRPKKLIGSLIQALSLNPVTKLLGTWALQAHVEQKLRTRQHFAFLYLDLDNFKAYNDTYGFAQGDAAIRMLAGTVIAAVRERGTPGDLASHIGGDDFAVLTTPDHAEAIARQIIAAFDGTVPSLYSAEDRARGSITVTDRRGEIVTYPLMTVSIAGVLTSKRPVTSYRELSDIASELKRYAKSLPGSIYVEERRRGEAETPRARPESSAPRRGSR
jgi:diguanylate cyclase (GGDEF)-like protein